MKGLNIANMKKVHEDDKCATFRHDSGHEIKVAKRGLSPAMQKELAGLPLHAAKGVSVETAPGDSDDYNPADVALQSAGVQSAPQDQGDGSVSAPDPTALPPPTPGSAGDTGLATEPTAQQLEANNPAGAQGSQTQPQTDAAQPSAQPTPTTDQVQTDQQAAAPKQQAQAAAQPQPDTVKDSLLKNDNEAAQALAMGMLKPEHVFNHDSTMGRIGTLFGLMIGGAGAGLSHQPNALLEMMQKELDRDASYKKQGAQTVVDMFKLHQEKALQNSQIAMNSQQMKLAQQELAVKTFSFKKMLENRAALQGLTDIVNKYPPGSEQYQKASQTLASLHNTVNLENASLATTAESQAQFLKMLTGGGQQQPSGDTEQQFQQRQNTLPILGPQGVERQKFEQERHVSGEPEIEGQTASRPVPEDAHAKITAMHTMSDKGRDLLNFAKQHKGSVDPNILAQGAQKAEEMVNFYNQSVQPGGALTEGKMEWLDKQIGKNPTTIFQDVLGNNAKLKEIVDSNDTRKQTLEKSFGYHPKQVAPQAQSIAEGTTGVSKSTGKKVIRRNGQWVPQ